MKMAGLECIFVELNFIGLALPQTMRCAQRKQLVAKASKPLFAARRHAVARSSTALVSTLSLGRFGRVTDVRAKPSRTCGSRKRAARKADLPCASYPCGNAATRKPQLPVELSGSFRVRECT